LDAILADSEFPHADPRLLVGNDTRDDAAVLELGDGTAVISTTDFFMPIVDDARDFGRIASVNALSDVYAMGGRPILAIGILGWPVRDLPVEVAREVVEGARQVCQEAGMPLAGGHSIDSPEPIFGLAVTGRVEVAHLKRNAGARAGDVLFLTKPLGLGILTTAEKQGKLRPMHAELARDTMLRPNIIGVDLGRCDWVHAMTDVTGFGLLGHLGEMCVASGLGAELQFGAIPLLEPGALHDYIDAGCVPGGTHNNWRSYGESIAPLDDVRRKILCDPQTSGGLLIAVDAAHVDDMRRVAAGHDLDLDPIGTMVPETKHRITVR
jgi:selenide,water dikinase